MRPMNEKKQKWTTIILLFSVLFSFANNNCFANESTQNLIEINGTVTDSKNGDPLPGVSILIKGTSTGTITDLDGKYKLEVPSNAALVFSFMGYIDQEVQVNEATVINISLNEDVIGLEEVVVVGYGVQKKSDLTGSVASVSAEKLNSVPIPSIDHALQGMAAGVNIIPKSGKPGEGVDIQIRGISSINGTKPKIVIDGIAQDEWALGRINPSDIASIEILKDASSAAIYGATGGNGVILVTTKKGTAGKMRVNVNAYRGIENPVNTLDMMNSQEYVELVEELQANKTVPVNYQPDTLPTYDWQDMAFQQVVSENYDVSISGGNDASTYLFSTSFNKQGGIVKNTDYQRFTIRVNSEHKVNKRMTFDEKITYVNSQTDGFDDWVWHGFYNTPIVGIISMDPTVPGYDKNGDWSISPFNVGNPLPNIDMIDKVKKKNNFEGNFGLKINLLKGLDFQTRIAPKLGLDDDREYMAIYWASPTNFRTNDELAQNMKKNLSWNFQNIINYQTTIAETHNISAMVGTEASKWWWYDISGARVDMASSDINMLYFDKSVNDSLSRQFVKGKADNGASQAYFGRLNYDYKGIYLLTVNIRRDGSSNFGPNYRWGTFPSFSVGWKFSEMDIIKDIPIISTGKIRVGYGQTGANAKDGFPFLPLVVTRAEFRYTVDGQNTQVGTGPNQIANPDLHWESVNETDFGLDMTFFENRISLTADYFNKVNDGMILEKETSVIAGTYNGDMPEVNFGGISNKGFEITIGARKNTGELTGSVDLNLSHVKNEVLELETDSSQNGSIHTIQPTNMTLIGYPVAQFYGWEIDRMFTEDDAEIIDGELVITNQPYYIRESDTTTIYAQPDALPGDAKFKDQDGDGKINNSDRVLLGSPLPKFSFGFSINLQYKIFDLSAFFNGTYGNKIMNGSKQYLYNPVGYGNRGKVFADRYRDQIVKDGMVVVNENHNTDVYRLSDDTYAKMSEFFVDDGSFLRCRNLMLGVTIPKSLSNKIGVEKLRLYAGGKNLFTITKYTGLNPEVGPSDTTNPILTLGCDIGLYPVTKMFYFGANLEF